MTEKTRSIPRQPTVTLEHSEGARYGLSAPLVSVHGPLLGQGKVCERVLRNLPHWFGIESAVLNYIRSADELPSFVAYVAGDPVGIALVKRHFELSAEVYLIGVLVARHRTGIGRALIAAMECWLGQQGVLFLQVKTLSSRSAHEGYARTRAFYLALGFAPLEEFPTLWDEENPCLMLIKRVGLATAAPVDGQPRA